MCRVVFAWVKQVWELQYLLVRPSVVLGRDLSRISDFSPTACFFLPRNSVEVALPFVLPDFFVDPFQILPAHHSKRNLVCQKLCLKIGVMREDPDMPQFVGNGCAEFTIFQTVDKGFVERQDKLSRSSF